MKKTLLSLSILCMCGALLSCGSNTNSGSISKAETQSVSVIVPEGTPALALANFYSDNSDCFNTFDIVKGSDPLVAAFTSESYDVIVAPTNLGAKLYSGTKSYILYDTIVWGNLFLASKAEIPSLSSLSGKTVHVFGKNSTPDIVLRALLAENNIEDVTLDYTFQDVESANQALLADQAEIIVSAQPALTKIQAAKNLYSLDLQTEWGKIANSSSYPQASVFFKKSLAGKIDESLEKISNSVRNAVSNPASTAEKATSMNKQFETLGAQVLEAAIPNCHFGIDENQKAAIEFYFNKMSSLNLGAAYGNTLPDEDFYYHK